jgi:small-conductance mechanosensitive channel/CRP-like cAMP-binding protein
MDVGQAGLAALLEHILQRWAFILLGSGIVLFAGLVNRFAPAKRRRIRRVIIPFALYLVLWGISASFAAGHAPDWAERIRLAADLFESFTVVNLAALAVFDLGLPALRVEATGIVADLFVGGSYVVAILSTVHGSGVSLGSVITTSAVVSGIFALSLQATLGNVLGGIALQLDHSIDEGDWIQLPDGTQGKVRAIRWRHTVVETRNWDTLIVPNANLLAANLVILGKRIGAPVQHRMWVYFNVDFRHSPTHVIQIVRDAILSTPIDNVARTPPANVICYDFAKEGRDSFGYYAVRYWLTDLAVDDPTSSAVRERIYAALRRAGIPLARPVQTVFFAPDDTQDSGARVARHRAERAKVLGDVELFKALTGDERAQLADHLIPAPFVRGETITHQGAVAHWLYILVSGKAEIRANVEGDPHPHLVATLEAPAIFGEMGLMTGAPRSADVCAITDVECYRLDKAGFQDIIASRPAIAEAMSETMATRRLELNAARDGVPVESRRGEQQSEASRIARSIRAFFGLGADAS